MAHPSRRRDDPYAQDDYYGRNPPYWDAGEPPAGPPPRRSKSERHRDPPEDRGASRRHRDDGAPRGSSHRNGDGRHTRSPPPSYHYDDRRGGDSRRDPRDYRDYRDSRDPRDARGMRDPRASRNDRDYHDEPRGLRRSKTAEPDRYRRPSLDHKSRDYPPRDDRDRDHDRRGGYAKTRGRDPSPAHGARTKTRDFADGPDRDGGRDRDRHGGHSSRSHAKDKALTKDVAAAEPSRGRDKNTAPSGGGGGARGFGGKVRSATMPAAQTAAKWWQNPLVQAGARTALSAGATAAMNNRGAQGEWLGAKGAKVATAALGAALMDGFMGGGQKKDQGGGGGDARGRERSSSRDRDRDRSRDRGGKSGGGRSKSEGRGGDMKQRIMQSGMEYMMKKAAAR